MVYNKSIKYWYRCTLRVPLRSSTYNNRDKLTISIVPILFIYRISGSQPFNNSSLILGFYGGRLSQTKGEMG